MVFLLCILGVLLRYLLILFCWFLSGVANAGVGDIDAREYVNWSESPYNRFVYFESGGGVCTAQYVGRDVILTARHCVDDDGFTVGSKYRITLHDGSKTYVTLEKYGPTKNEDWALLRVNDSNFYMDSYFDVSATEQYIHIENTGFGYMRILSDEEIKYIKQVVTQVKQADKTGTRSFQDIMLEIMPKLTDAGIQPLIDFACDDLSKEECWRFKLKSDKTCSISEYWDYEKKYSIDMWRTGGYVFYDYIVPTTCDAWSGNSGGAYFVNNTIYGICSSGADSWQDAEDTDFAATPTLFYSAVQEMRKTGKSAVVSQSLESESDVNIATTTDQGQIEPIKDIESNVVDSVSPQVPDFTEQEAELNQMDSKLLNEVQDVESMNDDEFVNFLDHVTEYDVLRQNLARAKAREQSTGNRILGAVTIGASGIGGMMLASGLAEQAADENAERDMAAYIATFKCSYGNGTNITGGAKDVQIPPADISVLRHEYITLALDLKQRKEVLNLSPGIESDAVLNIQNIGLYDTESLGMTGSGYTSVYRALMDTDSDDATAWAVQTADAKQKTKTGKIVGGVGLGVGVVGNITESILNDKNNEKNMRIK